MGRSRVVTCRLHAIVRTGIVELPASNAGIRVDTYVVAVDDQEIRDLIEYCAAVSTPGSHSITTSSDDTDSSRDWTLNAGVW